MLAKFMPGLLLVLAGGAAGIGGFTFAVKYLGAEEQARLQRPSAQGIVLDSNLRYEGTSDDYTFTVTFDYEADGVRHEELLARKNRPRLLQPNEPCERAC